MHRSVDLHDWHLRFGLSSYPEEHSLDQQPRTAKLSTPYELLCYISDCDGDDSAIQSQIRKRLTADSVASEWHKLRSRIGTIQYFKAYRETSHYEEFHEAAKAISKGEATETQKEMVAGLESEIKASKVILPGGQDLFHGRGEPLPAVYPSFISTSLDPIVCVQHAIKRSLQLKEGALPILYALTLVNEQPGIWGNGGKFQEWEILIGTNIETTQLREYTGRRFHVIEAAARKL